MQNDNHTKTIVIGTVGHIEIKKLSDFKKLLESLPYFRLIRFQESNNKLWLVEREGMNHYNSK